MIQIRASAEAKAIHNRAVALRGQKLSEFVLESARRQAEEAILDQRIIFLDDKAHKRLLALPDSPPQTAAKAARDRASRAVRAPRRRTSRH